MNTNYIEFLRGFADGGKISFARADASWAGFSSGLDNEEREAEESLGYARGLELGKEMLKLYPDGNDGQSWP